MRKKVFLLVGFEGLPEMLTQYNPNQPSTFIFQDKPGNRFFVEKFLNKKELSLPVFGFPTSVVCGDKNPNGSLGQSLAFQQFTPDQWASFLRIPEFVRQIKDYITSLQPISEIIWYNRQDLWVSLVLSVAKDMKIPTLLVQSERNAKIQFNYWNNEKLREINPQTAGFIDQLNGALSQQLLLADMYLDNIDDGMLYSGLSPTLEGHRQLDVSLDEVSGNIIKLKRELNYSCDVKPNKLNSGIFFVDDGMSFDDHGYNWEKTRDNLKRYFIDLPIDIPVTIKLRQVRAEDEGTKNQLVELFPARSKIRFAQSFMPLEFMISDFDTVFYILTSSMLYPFKTRRICLFKLLTVEKESFHARWKIYMKYIKSLSSGDSLIITESKSIVEDLVPH